MNQGKIPTSAGTSGSSSALAKGVNMAKDAKDNSTNPQVPEGAQPGDKVAPGKVVNEKGEVENSDTRELLDAGLNVASIFTGGATGAAKQAGTQVAKQGAQQAAKQGAQQAAKQGAQQAAKQGGQQAAKGAASTAKGAGAGNKKLLTQSPMGDELKNKAMEKVGGAIDKGMGHVADAMEKNEAIKQIAKDNKEELKTINRAFDTVGAAMAGDKEGVKKNAKEFFKNAKEAKKKQIKKQLLLWFIGAIGFLFTIGLPVIIIILPFIGGYVAMDDFLESAGEGVQNAWQLVVGGDENEDEALKAIVGDVPGWDSLSQNRKRLTAAAALAVGTPYKGGGRPTSATKEGIAGGVDAGGLAEWVVWNMTGTDPGYLNGSAITSSTSFTAISESELLPGDFGVNGQDVGIYMGNGNWIHVDPSAGVIRGPYSGYTSFYRYNGIDGGEYIDGGGGSGGGGTVPATGKLKDVFPNGVPQTEAEVRKYLVTVSVPITKKNGTKTTTSVTVHKAIANDLKAVLQQAQNAGFKVYEVQGFSWRNISGSSKMSQHSLGLAVDINVNENYCVYPSGKVDAGSFWDPSRSEYSIPSNGILVKAFSSIGWGWGGTWNSKKDYMHFSYTGG